MPPWTVLSAKPPTVILAFETFIFLFACKISLDVAVELMFVPLNILISPPSVAEPEPVEMVTVVPVLPATVLFNASLIVVALMTLALVGKNVPLLITEAPALDSIEILKGSINHSPLRPLVALASTRIPVVPSK